MKSIAVGVVRNCADIIAFSTLHHILLGVDHCFVIDNGSTDGTMELLKAIAKKAPKLCVIADPSPYEQERIVGAVINEVTRAEKAIVIPFDSDELWDAPIPKLKREFSRGTANILECEIINFVQNRRVKTPSPFSWMRAYRRAPLINGEAHSLVRSQAISFVEAEFPPKVLFQAEGSVELAKGAHSVAFAGSRKEFSAKFACFHLPIRSRQELFKRAYDYAPRIAPFRKDAGHSWQSAYFRERLDRDMLDVEWKANSFDGAGCIDIYGVKRRSIRDTSLVQRLSRAYAYGLYLGVPMRAAVQ